MEEARAKTREPIHLLDGMMPGMRAPHESVVVLRPMNPIEEEVHHEQTDDDLHRAGQVLYVMNRHLQEGRNEIDRQAADEPVGNAVDRERERERENVEFQIEPTVDWMRRPDPFADLEKDDQPEESNDLIIFSSHRHKPVENPSISAS